MVIMPANSYLEEYRQKYGSVSLLSKTDTIKSRTPTSDVHTLLEKYLGPNHDLNLDLSIDGNINGIGKHNSVLKYSSNSLTINGGEYIHEEAAKATPDNEENLSAKPEESDGDEEETFEDGFNNALLPTTSFLPHRSITVDEIMKKDAKLGEIKHKVVMRHHSNPTSERDNSKAQRQKRRYRAVSLDDSSESCFESPRMMLRSDSDKSLRRIKRCESTLSNQSVESNASNRSNISLHSDILEIISDEDFDFDLDIDIASSTSKQSDSDSQKLMSTFKLDSDSQRDAESLTGVDGTETCTNCKPLSARSASSNESAEVSLCSKCTAKRIERQATIQEMLDSEFSYLRDLNSIKEHYHDALLKNGLLKAEEVANICGNIERLIAVSNKYYEQLKDHLDTLKQRGDEFYNEAAVGQLICDLSAMFLAFEDYCINYNNASVLIEQLRRENELFNLFLDASQNDNPALRRMDLKTFLMIPVQRIMKYPLLLKRLHKATHQTHPDRECIERANEKLTNILHHINTQSKLISAIMLPNSKDSSGSAKKKTSFEIALTKLVLDTLCWKHDEIHFLNSGKIGLLQPTENQTFEKIKSSRFNTAYAVVVSKGQGHAPKISNRVMFRKTSKVSNVALLVIKKGTSRLQMLCDPIHLADCIVSRNSEFYDVLEIQYSVHDTFVIRPAQSTDSWYKNLKYFSMVLGGRNQDRRKALSNILLPD